VKLLGRLPSREIEHFSSHGFRHTRVALGHVQVSLADLNGAIGGHEASSDQLLILVSGRVAVSTRDESGELGVGEAVRWEEGEWHETRSLEPSTVLIVEGEFDDFS
jgi:mannose-6-phosphate isomerase-like protein (cupin superfamily)